MKSRYQLWGYCLLLTLLITVVTVCAIEFFQSEEMLGYERQHQEEQLANAFLQEIRSRQERRNIEETPEETQVEIRIVQPKTETITPTAPADQVDLNYSDDNYEVIGGVKYTPDYAAGRLDCVLEIPKIRMRRGVYTGAASEIQHDLDIWMTTTAHTDYVLGETHYCIYGHNSPTQSLSFNDLKHVGVGDIFLLTTEDYVFLYDVTDFYPQWRELVKREITDNFTLPVEKCYIITCGRDQYRYKDIIVEGTLRKRYSIREWNTAEEEFSKTEDNQATEAAAEKLTTVRKPTKLCIELQDNTLFVRLTDEAGVPIPGVKLCITDANGLFLQEIERNLVTDTEGKAEIPAEVFREEAYYAVGVLEMDTEKYSVPSDVEFMIRIRNETREIVSEEVSGNDVTTDYYMLVWGVLLLSVLSLTAACLIRIVQILRTMKKNRKKVSNGNQGKEMH